jgi:hypothetical protein
MTRRQSARWLLVALVLAAMLAQWRALPVLAAPFNLGGGVLLVYLGLSIACLAGLMLARTWGFVALYILVPFGTVMLSVSFVPLSFWFLPVSVRWVGLTLVNAAVLVFAGFAHYWMRRDEARPPGSAA